MQPKKSLSFGLHFSFASTKSGDIETPRSGRPHVQASALRFCERGYGEIGRHARFRFWCRKAWEFKSLYPHQSWLAGGMTGLVAPITRQDGAVPPWVGCIGI